MKLRELVCRGKVKYNYGAVGKAMFWKMGAGVDKMEFSQMLD